MHPYEWGILSAKRSRSCWLSEERFSRHHRHQPAASLANRIAGARKLLASAAFGRTAPTGLCRARRRSIVKAVVLYTLGLALGFNIDSRSRQAQFYQSPNCPIKLSCLGFQSERERNSCLPTIPIAVLQKPLICKKCSNSTLVRTFDMACYATTVLITRIEEDSRGVGVQKITPKTTILYKK